MTLHLSLKLLKGGECKNTRQMNDWPLLLIILIKIVFTRFGPSQIQPSVGDAGAPVFTFKG